MQNGLISPAQFGSNQVILLFYLLLSITHDIYHSMDESYEVPDCLIYR